MIKSSNISYKIRQVFFDFFQKNSHKVVSSSNLVPKDDPTLLFTNAGMVQFKSWFTGEDSPKYKNVVSIQKCLRAGGKHNDLENVGFTSRHHTFFEMLGNFSFGGYFKEQAIIYAWDFLSKELSLDKKKLIITVYNKDLDSQKIWKKITGFTDNQILKISSDDNFWSMGDIGPCGPCSEIFYDNGEKLSGSLPGSKNQDGERFVEIWNLVFMEYEKKNGKLIQLPVQCVDTGMGLERITAVLSKKTNNFDTDLFNYLFSQIEKTTGVRKNQKILSSFRIISDHIRAITFLMSEGILPSNEGRGYVLRRIIRRALMHVYKISPGKLILNQLVKSISEKYSEVYYELLKSSSFIEKNLENEERKFSETLEIGMNLLNEEIIRLKGKSFSPDIAFKLYDTFGFPVDMTKSILSEKNIFLDLKAYEKIVLENKQKQKDSWVGVNNLQEKKILLDLKSSAKKTSFMGYKFTSYKSKLKCIISDNSEKKSVPPNSGNLILVFDSTPFYAESGGQVGDSGVLKSVEDKIICKILNTKKIDGDIFLHFCDQTNLSLGLGKDYILEVNTGRREKIRNNHSATHLLHESLRQVVGEHVSQKGSLVNERKLRFDYTSNQALSEDQIFQVEDLVNNSIRSNLKTEIKIMPVKKAIESGAIALFGEKYPEKVRVVSMVSPRKSKIISSTELCGGTHVQNTGQIGFFKILADFSISSGVRRVEAITGKELEKYINKKLEILTKVKNIFKATDDNLLECITTFKNEHASLKKNKNKPNQVFLKEKIVKLKDLEIYCHELSCSPKELKNYSDTIKKSLGSGIIIIFVRQKEKISIVVSVTEDLEKKYNSVKILKDILSFLGGSGGGGRNDLAQGGAKYSKKVNEIENFIKKSINY